MNTDATLSALQRATVQSLSAVYPQSEAQWLWREMMLRIKGWDRVQLAIRANDPVSDFVRRKVSETTSRLLAHEPIQYIFGMAEFYGLQLHVSPAVLIPRPETAELVDLIVRQADDRPDLRVLDICTGSGCIAVALARNLRFPLIEAIDLSPEALDIAARNASDLKVRVNFSQRDALHLSPEPSPRFDIIVSNPPYIAEREKSLMDANVLDHEPAMALFVPDSNPLIFYHAIATYAMSALVPGGRLYFEINPIFASQLVNDLKAQGWQDVNVLPDMQRLNRFIYCTRP